MDPRFKQVLFLSEEDILEAYQSLTVNTVFEHQKPVIKVEPEDKAPEEPNLPNLLVTPERPVEASASGTVSNMDIDDSAKPRPAKKPAMSCLLGFVYVVKAKSLQDRLPDEITNYKLEYPVPTNESPLD